MLPLFLFLLSLVGLSTADLSPIEKHPGSFTRPAAGNTAPDSHDEGSVIDFEWATDYDRSNLFLITHDDYGHSQLIVGSILDKAYSWTVNLNVSTDASNSSAVYRMRIVNALGTTEDRANGGFLSGSFLIVAKSLSSTSTATATNTVSASGTTLALAISTATPSSSTASSASSSSSSSTSTSASATPTPSTGLTASDKAGVSAGVSLGVVLTAVVVVGFYLLRRSHQRLLRLALDGGDRSKNLEGGAGHQSQTSSTSIPVEQKPAIPTQELPALAPQELPADKAPRELAADNTRLLNQP